MEDAITGDGVPNVGRSEPWSPSWANARDEANANTKHSPRPIKAFMGHPPWLQAGNS